MSFFIQMTRWVKKWFTGWTLVFFKSLLAVVLLALLFSSDKMNWSVLKTLQSPFVGLISIFSFSLIVLINTNRWQNLLQIENVIISFWKAFKLSMIGLFFNSVLLGGMGGDIVRATYLVREKKEKRVFIIWSVFVDRLLGLYALFFFPILGGVFFYNEMTPLSLIIFYGSLIFIFLPIIFLLILSYFPKIFLGSRNSLGSKLKKIQKFGNDVKNFFKTFPALYSLLSSGLIFVKKPNLLAFPLFLSFAGQGIIIGGAVGLAQFLNEPAPVWSILTLLPFGFFLTILPITPGGLGVGQWIFYHLFESEVGCGGLGIWLISFLQMLQLILGLFGSGFFLLYKKEVAYGYPD